MGDASRHASTSHPLLQRPEGQNDAIAARCVLLASPHLMTTMRNEHPTPVPCHCRASCASALGDPAASAKVNLPQRLQACAYAVSVSVAPMPSQGPPRPSPAREAEPCGSPLDSHESVRNRPQVQTWEASSFAQGPNQESRLFSLLCTTATRTARGLCSQDGSKASPNNRNGWRAG